MKTDSNVAKVASLMSETSRATILTILLDGRFHSAGELANIVRIKPQTASFHLAKLVNANIISVEKQGRHRYYGIDNQEIAQVMECLLSIAPPTQIKSLKQSLDDEALRYARTCYDHLAGNIGVQVTDALLAKGILRQEGRDYIVTDAGEKFFADIQIDLDHVKKRRRSFSHRCLDWSERRHHLAGALGNALLEKMLELNWVKRSTETRALYITNEGKKGLKEIFSLDVD